MKHSKDNTIAAADAEEEGCNAVVLASWQNSFVDCVTAADQEAARIQTKVEQCSRQSKVQAVERVRSTSAEGEDGSSRIEAGA